MVLLSLTHNRMAIICQEDWHIFYWLWLYKSRQKYLAMTVVSLEKRDDYCHPFHELSVGGWSPSNMEGINMSWYYHGSNWQSNRKQDYWYSIAPKHCTYRLSEPDVTYMCKQAAWRCQKGIYYCWEKQLPIHSQNGKTYPVRWTNNRHTVVWGMSGLDISHCLMALSKWKSQPGNRVLAKCYSK